MKILGSKQVGECLVLFGQEALFFHFSIYENNFRMYRTILLGVELGLI